MIPYACPQDPLLLAFKKMLLQELNLDFKYIRSPKKGNSWLYITFFQREQQEKALKLLKHYVWKGRTLICTVSTLHQQAIAFNYILNMY